MESNEQTKQKQTHRYREQTDGCQRKGGLGDWVKSVMGSRSRGWKLQNSHGDVKYSTGNTVDNTVITTYGVWVLEISGGYFVEYMIVQLYATPLKLI